MHIPNQAVPESKKTEDWGKQTINAHIFNSSFGMNRRKNLGKLYNAATGVLDENEYRYRTNPYKKDKKKKFPAKMRNHPIIPHVVEALLGELSKRKINKSVKVSNPDAVSIFQQKKKEFLSQQVKNKLLLNLKELGIQVSSEEELRDLPTIQEQFRRSYKDQRAITGQHVINHLIDYCDIIDKRQKGFFDFLSVGEVYSYRGVNHNEVEYRIIYPENIDYSASEGTKFVEDADRVSVRYDMSLSEIVAYFQDELKPGEVKDLEDRSLSDEENFDTNTSPLPDNDGDMWQNDNIPVYHVCWKSKRKVGILTFYDEYGKENKIKVDETFKPREGEDVTWYWDNEVWEGWRIGKTLYKRIRPLPIQRSSIDNSGKCKMPYNGILAVDRGDENVSLVQKGLTYQVLYNIYHYELELLIGRNKGKIALLDINAIPSKDGWDEYQFMYFADTQSYAFFDGNSSSVKHSGQVMKVLDMGLEQEIAQFVQLLDAIRNEWYSLAGITPQRLGDISPYAGKATTERAVYHSSTISEELFRRYDHFVKKDLEALLDYSKVAYINGKKGNYVLDDGSLQFFEIDPVEHASTEYGMFISNAAADQEKFQILKEAIPTFIQNASPMSLVAEMIDSDNFASLKDKIKEVEKIMKQANQKQAQMEQQIKEAELADKQAERDFEASENEKDRQNEINKALINAEARMSADMFNKDEDDDIGKLRQEYGKQSLEREKMIREDRNKDKELNFKKKELESKEKIEKLKAKTALKNRVPGEKSKK